MAKKKTTKKAQQAKASVKSRKQSKPTKTKANPRAIKYYKVVTASGTGGHTPFQYGPYLPKDGQPGKWLVIPKGLSLGLCSTGFHVTSDPDQWKGSYTGSRVFLVEIEGEKIVPRGDNKICCRKIRLTQEVVKINGQWVPKAPPKTYTQSEVDAIKKETIAKVRDEAVKLKDEVAKIYQNLANLINNIDGQ